MCVRVILNSMIYKSTVSVIHESERLSKQGAIQLYCKNLHSSLNLDVTTMVGNTNEYISNITYNN